MAPIKQLSLARWQGPLTAIQWHAVGMWWAKVGLMLGHPEARYEHRKLNQEAIRFDSGRPDYKWMVNGSQVPTDLSVFVHHPLMDAGQPVESLVLPQYMDMSDGSVRESHVFQIVTPDISVSVVSHPGMTLVHPLVECGEAWELLRGAEDGGDLSDLPQHGHRRVVFVRGIRAHEGFQVDSSEASKLAALIAHEVDQMPECYPGS